MTQTSDSFPVPSAISTNTTSIRTKMKLKSLKVKYIANIFYTNNSLASLNQNDCKGIWINEPINFII